MASPVTFYASQPTSHFFRESHHSDDFPSRRLGEGAMGPHRSHPYQRERSHSPPKRYLDYRISRSRDTEHARQTLPSRGPPAPVHATHSVPMITASPESSLTRQHDMSFDQNRSEFSRSDPYRQAPERPDSRMHISHQVDERIPTSRLPYQQDPRNAPRPNPSDRSPARGTTESMENGRLPGIGSLLGLAPDNQGLDRRFQHPPPAPSVYPQPRYQGGHSQASSLSSDFSQPTSPGSYGGHNSRSPIAHPQPHPMDDRGGSLSHHPHQTREEPPSHYDQLHHRSQTLPSLPTHSQHAPQYQYQGHPPPPPPSGPNAMLPPPPDPFHHQPQSFSNGRPIFQSTNGQFNQHWDRQRIDSVLPYPEQHSMQPYWFPGPHGPSSMARKRRGNLPKEATKLLKEWFGLHHDSPYTTEDEKQDLCRSTGLQISQVNNWFINARRRLPREDAKKQAERKENDERAGTVESMDSDAQDGENLSHPALEPGVRYV